MTLLWILIPYAALGAVLTLWVQRDWQPVGDDGFARRASRNRGGSDQTGSAMVPMAACMLGATLKKQTESTGLRPARAASAGTFRREGHHERQRRQRDQRLGRNPGNELSRQRTIGRLDSSPPHYPTATPVLPDTRSRPAV
jgi:hypothetical protein